MDLPRALPEKVAPIVRAAIKTTQQVAPASATEIPYKMAQPRSKSMMWKLVRYAVDGENVVGVGAFTDHAAMFFYRGRELDEESKVLQGTGKDTRYLTLRAPADAASPEVKRLLRKAFQLGGAA